jgi:superfamily I DNA/RNA helicase
MKERVTRLLGEEAHAVVMGTFHALCAILLRRHGRRIALDSKFGIADAADRCDRRAAALRVRAKRCLSTTGSALVQ